MSGSVPRRRAGETCLAAFSSFCGCIPSWRGRLWTILTNRSKVFRSHFKLQRGNLLPVEPKDIKGVVIVIGPFGDWGWVVKTLQHDLGECDQVRVFPCNIDRVLVVLRIE